MKKNRTFHGIGQPCVKLLLVMRLTIYLFFALVISVQAKSYSQTETLTLNMSRTNLVDVLNEIEKQSDYYFYYNLNLDNYMVGPISAKDKGIKEVLNMMLNELGLTHEVVDRYVVIKKIEIGIGETLVNTSQQQKTISGKVTDNKGVNIPGVAIIVKGTTIGTITDGEGNYILSKVPEDAVLQYSFVGMKMQEVLAENKTIINITMTEESFGIDEVVAVGYGTMRKSDLTGSVTRVSMEEKSLRANINLLQALSGATAGVNVQGTGLAGSEPDLSVRGQTSLSASDKPLIVLDGIIYNGSISDINTNDIESIDILKDASSAAVYGSRSANGVMIITSKKGKTEKPVVSFNMYYGYQDMTNNPMKVMNSSQYAIRLVDYYYQQSLYTWYKTNPTSPAGKPIRPDITDPSTVALRLRTQEERNNYLAGNEINWVDEVLHIAPIQNYNLNLSGRTERSNYFISTSYTDEAGIQLNDKFNRFTLHSNFESKVTDWFTLGLITSYSYRDYSGLEAQLSDARASSPLANNHIGSSLYDMYLTGEFYMAYPLNNLYVTNSDTRNNLFMVGSGKIKLPWIKGLTYDINYSNTYSNRNNFTFYPANVPDGSKNKGQAIKNPSDESNWIFNNIISYLGTFGDHHLNTTLLYSRESRSAQSSTLNAQGFDNPVLGYNNMGLGTIVTVASTAWKESSLSYMARVNYSYKNRYMITATVRKDGFSGFGVSKKFTTFPSVSLGWVLSDEPFLNSINHTYLKLRTSYGENGNQGIGRYSSFSRMTTDNYIYGSQTGVAVYPSSLGNDDLGWETTSSFNIGVDYGFLNRRISGTIDVYKSNTKNVLVNRALPPTTGYLSVWSNIGGIDNKGIELELVTINLDGRLKWKTNFVFSMNRDKINKLYGGLEDKDIGNSWFVGKPISSIYDYKMAGGLWTENELYSGKILKNWYPGQFRYIDQNGDGIIEPNSDRTIIGYKTPNYRFSINNTFSYRNFAFSFFINSIQGGNGYYLQDNSSVVNVDWLSDNVYRINASAVRPYWTPDNGVNNSTGVYNAPPVTSGIYESRSFVRLQDVSLSYKFGPTLTKMLKVDGCQFYIASKNTYTWTKWSGWDPETGTSNSPLMRNIIIGFNITF